MIKNPSTTQSTKEPETRPSAQPPQHRLGTPFLFDPSKGIISARNSQNAYRPSSVTYNEAEILCNNISCLVTSLKGWNYNAEALKYISTVLTQNAAHFILPMMSIEWEKLFKFTLNFIECFKPEPDYDAFIVLLRIINEHVAPNENISNEQKKIIMWKYLLLNWYDNPVPEMQVFTVFMDEYRKFLTKTLPTVFQRQDFVSSTLNLGALKDYLNRRMSLILEELLKRRKATFIAQLFKFVELLANLKNIQLITVLTIPDDLKIDSTISDFLSAYLPELTSQLTKLAQQPVPPQSLSTVASSQQPTPPASVMREKLPGADTKASTILSEDGMSIGPAPKQAKKKKISMAELRAFLTETIDDDNKNKFYQLLYEFFIKITDPDELANEDKAELKQIMSHVQPALETLFTQKQIDKIIKAYAKFANVFPGLDLLDPQKLREIKPKPEPDKPKPMTPAINQSQQQQFHVMVPSNNLPPMGGKKALSPFTTNPNYMQYNGNVPPSGQNYLIGGQSNAHQIPATKSPDESKHEAQRGINSAAVSPKKKKRFNTGSSIQSFLPAQAEEAPTAPVQRERPTKDFEVRGSKMKIATDVLESYVREALPEFKDRIAVSIIGSFGAEYDSDLTSNINFCIYQTRGDDPPIDGHDVLRKLCAKIVEKKAAQHCTQSNFNGEDVVTFDIQVPMPSRKEREESPSTHANEEESKLRSATAANLSSRRALLCTVIFDSTRLLKALNDSIAECIACQPGLKHVANCIRKSFAEFSKLPELHGEPPIAFHKLLLLAIKALQTSKALQPFGTPQDSAAKKISAEELLEMISKFARAIEATQNEPFRDIYDIYTLTCEVQQYPPTSNSVAQPSQIPFLYLRDPIHKERNLFDNIKRQSRVAQFILDKLKALSKPQK